MESFVLHMHIHTHTHVHKHVFSPVNQQGFDGLRLLYNNMKNKTEWEQRMSSTGHVCLLSSSAHEENLSYFYYSTLTSIQTLSYLLWWISQEPQLKIQRAALKQEGHRAWNCKRPLVVPRRGDWWQGQWVTAAAPHQSGAVQKRLKAI